MTSVAIAAGFADPVHDAQAAFRTVLTAMSSPGHITSLARLQTDVPGLESAAAVLLLTLADHETPVWLDEPACCAADWLRFHTGAKIASNPEQAMFAVIDGRQDRPSLDRFNLGDDRYPDRSTTVIGSCDALVGGFPLVCSGPGIRGSNKIAPRGVPADLWTAWAANGDCFPRGVDLVLVCGADLIALPRTTRVTALDGRG